LVIRKVDNSDAERVVDRFETNIDKIMTLDVEDGVHRRKDSRLSGDERSKNVTLMLMKALELLLVVERIGKKQRELERLKILNEKDRQMMTGITLDWYV
jgi:hypothetical protein